MKHWLLLAVVLTVIILPTSLAMRHTLNIKRDHRSHFLIEKFGFQEGGRLFVNITDLEPTPHASKSIKAMGLFITISKAEFINFVFPQNKCPLKVQGLTRSDSLTDSTNSLTLSKANLLSIEESKNSAELFDGSWESTDSGKGRRTISEVGANEIGSNEIGTKRDKAATPKYQTMAFEVTGTTLVVDQTVTAETAGLWSLYWVVCSTELPTYSFKLKLEQWNVLPNGQRSYLPTGEIPLPYIYGIFCLICLLLLAFWIGYFLCSANRKVNAVHWMMTVLLFFKILTLFCQSFMYGTLAKTGVAQGWNIAFYVFQSIRAVALFTVVLMIGTGWTFLKPYLSDSDKKIFFFVIPLQVLANIALIITEETMPGSSNWIFWLYFFRAIDILCCGAILIPIVSSMNHLKGAALSDGKARRSLEKLVLFRRFYLIVICYIYFTRIIVLLLNSTLPYQRTWIGPLVAELAAVIFYCIAGNQFRPIKDNPYFNLEQDESDQLELRAIEAIQSEDL